MPVTLLLWVEHNFVRKWVRLACCDWRYVIFVPIHNVDYFQSCLLQRAFHRSSYLFSFWGKGRHVSTASCDRIFQAEQLTSFCFWSCNGDLNQPFLPNNLFLVASANPSQPAALPSLLVEELYGDLSTNSTVRCI